MPSDAFNTAAEEVKNLAGQPSNDEMLKIYSLFKQVTIGDCNTPRPGMFDVKGRAKWDAWDARKGTEQAAAEGDYVTLVEELKGKYGMK